MKVYPKVSIVMPVYNSERYLAEAIESILDQTYNDFEFIIVDDGSTDESYNIISSYANKDNRIIVISREHRGLVDSLNEGINIARGKYIARMDADDISINNRIEKQFEFLELNKDVDILGTRIEAFGDIDEKQKTIYNSAFSIKFDSQNIEQVFLTSCAIPHPSVMFKKDSIVKLRGYRKEYDTAEDYDLWLRAIRNGYKIVRMDECLIKYRVHNKSKTAVEMFNPKMVEYTMKAKIDYINDTNKKDKVDYLIWGASTGGKLVKKVVESTTDKFNLIGFIDKYKEGEVDECRIYKPEDLMKLHSDYVFIATLPGKEEADEFLKNCGLEKFKEYISLV
ncbi:glycosyl transferase [Clostridium acetobutylicum]|nr:glycosyl transferase [Clostridium acetobutylicum]